MKAWRSAQASWASLVATVAWRWGRCSSPPPARGRRCRGPCVGRASTSPARRSPSVDRCRSGSSCREGRSAYPNASCRSAHSCRRPMCSTGRAPCEADSPDRCSWPSASTRNRRAARCSLRARSGQPEKERRRRDVTWRAEGLGVFQGSRDRSVGDGATNGPTKRSARKRSSYRGERAKVADRASRTAVSLLAGQRWRWRARRRVLRDPVCRRAYRRPAVRDRGRTPSDDRARTSGPVARRRPVAGRRAPPESACRSR